MNPKRPSRKAAEDRTESARMPRGAAAESSAAETSAGGADGPDTATGSSAAELQNRLASLQAEYERASLLWRDREDGLLRQLAERDNQFRRLQRDQGLELTRKRGELLEPLIAVLDDFDRALEHLPADGDSAFADGVARIAESLREALARQGLSSIEAVGRKFDPNLHEALMQVKSDEVAKGHVVQEIQKGYMLGDRVLRPSKVAVSG